MADSNVDHSAVLEAVQWDEQGLVPAIAQDAASGEVLMVAWMNAEALKLSLDTGFVVYWSRSRRKLWKNGEESENVKIEKIKEELADVLSFSFLLADKHNLDIFDIVLEKIKKNAEKYPVDKAKGTAKKYNEL